MTKRSKPRGLEIDSDMEWISQHPTEVAQHAGEWIAVRNGIVASGKKLEEVLKSTDQQGIISPLFHRVHERGKDHFIF